MTATIASGVVVKEASSEEIWVMCGGTLVLVPTTDALAHLGYAIDQVEVVADGELDGITTIRLASLSSTPPSMVFPMARTPGGDLKWLSRTEIPGVSLPNGNHVVTTIVGVLKFVNDPFNRSDPDVGIDLVPHPTCLDTPGIDPSSFFKVGDILHSTINPRTTDSHAYVAAPVFHVEVCGFPATNVITTGSSPQDWNSLDDPTWPSNPTWPFWPPTALRDLNGHLVTVSGVLVADEPHTHSGDSNYSDAALQWQGQYHTYDAGNPARYTEIHPPDFVTAVSQIPIIAEELIGVAVSARPAILDPLRVGQALTITLAPATSQPPNTRLTVQEIVLRDTYLPSIVEGNPDRTGAAISYHDGSFDLHVRVLGQPGQDAGRFAAIYRVRWEPNPPTLTVTTNTVALDEPVTVVVTALDSFTHAAVNGQVLLNGNIVGQTGQGFSRTFASVWVWETVDGPDGREHRVRRREAPDVGFVVRAPGYPDSYVQMSFNTGVEI